MHHTGDQSAYWDKVAKNKTFTHPLNMDLLLEYADKNALLVDYGCGYGRCVRELQQAGYMNVNGYDSSAQLILRGNTDGVHSIFYLAQANPLPVADCSVDGILLFAVLTCTPSNSDQQKLIQSLHAKLKPGGFIYVSDYYLQENSNEMKKYEYLDGDKNNFGVFTLPEGASFRHHTREWITNLFSDFNLLKEIPVEVMTMNGHRAQAFQMVLVKN